MKWIKQEDKSLQTNALVRDVTFLVIKKLVNVENKQMHSSSGIPVYELNYVRIHEGILYDEDHERVETKDIVYWLEIEWPEEFE